MPQRGIRRNCIIAPFFRVVLADAFLLQWIRNNMKTFTSATLSMAMALLIVGSARAQDRATIRLSQPYAARAVDLNVYGPANLDGSVRYEYRAAGRAFGTVGKSCRCRTNRYNYLWEGYCSDSRHHESGHHTGGIWSWLFQHGCGCGSSGHGHCSRHGCGASCGCDTGTPGYGTVPDPRGPVLPSGPYPEIEREPIPPRNVLPSGARVRRSRGA